MSRSTAAVMSHRYARQAAAGSLSVKREKVFYIYTEIDFPLILCIICIHQTAPPPVPEKHVKHKTKEQDGVGLTAVPPKRCPSGPLPPELFDIHHAAGRNAPIHFAVCVADES